LFEGDIRTVDIDRIPNHDLLCAGFPCQAFSIAGKRKGFDDTRGTLFFEIARILETKRPKTALLENVKGLLSHDFGRTYWRILEVLWQLGYWTERQTLNSKNFGVPQNRERVFIVGHLKGKSFKQIFPIGESNEKLKFTNSKEACAITSSYSKGGKGNMIELTKNKSQGTRVYSPEGISQTISSVGGGQGAKTGLYSVGCALRQRDRHNLNEERKQQLELRKDNVANSITSVEKDSLVIQSHSPRSGNPKKGGTGALQSKEHCFTLDRTPHYLVSDKIRRLTPVECERLQGFPDNWTKGLSDTQRYKCLGNAVTVNVIQALGEMIKWNNQLCPTKKFNYG